ncbi:hypothetical protein GCM10009665_77180 [Kitasatospora nipponensis]|uniref:NodB homology domain-containing protein n=1 Tax=Kitasatospora nipponensis TaxID=258049 RepID=A0ABN1T8P8_9ACTN
MTPDLTTVTDLFSGTALGMGTEAPTRTGAPQDTDPARAGADRLAQWLRYSPAQPVFRARAARRLAVLAYRRVPDQRSFRAQLDRLCRTAVPISLRALELAVTHGRPLPPRSVLITFDDADRSVLEHALPALAARGVPAVAFVVTELVGTDRPSWRQEAAFLLEHGGHARALTGAGAEGTTGRLALLAAPPDPDRRRSLHELRVSARAQAPRRPRLTPEELRQLAAGPFAIGNQTLGGAELRRCDDATVRTEVMAGHQALTGWLGRPPTAFAYPGGEFEPRAAGLLDELGYRTGFLSDHRHSARLPDEALRVSRLEVDASGGRRHLATVLSGLHPAVSRWRGQ